MGIYCKEVENFLSFYNGIDNQMLKYDNFTYHIQLYIIPENIYRRYTEIKASGNDMDEVYGAIKKLLYNNKVILVESGITSNYDIQSLKMTMCPPVSEENKDMIMTSAEMTLVEVDGASFMNKVAMASMACGYDNFVQCPIFMEIWFDGYRNVDQVVDTKIPFNLNGNEINTFIVSCIMQGTGCQQEGNKTTYRLKLLPYWYSSTNKDLQIVNNLGTVHIDNTTSGLGVVLQELENKLNEKIVQSIGKEIYNAVYTDCPDGKPVVIKYADNLSYSGIQYLSNREADNSANNRYAKAVGESYVNTYSMIGDDINNQAKKDDARRAERMKKIRQAKGFWETAGSIGMGVLEDIGGGFQGAWEITKSIGVGTKNVGTSLWQGAKAITHIIFGKDYDTNDCKDISDLVKKILADWKIEDLGLQGKGIFIDYQPIYLRSFLGKRYYQHQIVLRLREIPGIKNQFGILKASIDESLSSPPHYRDDIITAQIDYLKTIFETGLLLKKYKWQFSGTNTDVLNLSYSDNNLWYMNIGISNFNMIKNTNWESMPNFSEQFKDSNISTSGVLDMDEQIQISYEGDKIHFVDGKIYIDDLYEQLIPDAENINASYKSIYNIVESNDPTSAIRPSSYKTGEEISDEEIQYRLGEVAYKIGMTNIFQMGGQRMKISMDIIGDPYWLVASTEVGAPANVSQVVFMPHIILSTKTNRTTTGMDEYRTDKLMELNTVYCISKVISTFENGKFTQNLEGFLATPFIQSSIDADFTMPTQEENEETAMFTSSAETNASQKTRDLFSGKLSGSQMMCTTDDVPDEGN